MTDHLADVAARAFIPFMLGATVAIVVLHILGVL